MKAACRVVAAARNPSLFPVLVVILAHGPATDLLVEAQNVPPGSSSRLHRGAVVFCGAGCFTLRHSCLLCCFRYSAPPPALLRSWRRPRPWGRRRAAPRPAPPCASPDATSAASGAA